MVDAERIQGWLCGNCGMDHDHKIPADECCKDEVEVEDEN